MPIVEHSATVNTSVTRAFDLSQSYELRLDWDPFVKEQHPLGKHTRADKGVQTFTRSRHGLVMVTEYLTFKRPTLVGMKMIKGPKIFRTFSGSWRFAEVAPDVTEVAFRYNFTCRPKLLAPIMERIGTWYLGRDIKRRIAAFKIAIETTDILSRLPDEP
jgi:ribosome-associated toxin RatA of RatAB toxin-antitoxin module